MYLESLSATILLGKDFAKQLVPKSKVLLKGPIGAGKTSFVKGVAEGLMIKENITSPTFALSHHYESGTIPLIHIDLYRLTNALSAEELFLEEEEEIENNQGILIIEWPEIIMPIISNSWLINIDYANEKGRTINIYQPTEFKNF